MNRPHIPQLDRRKLFGLTAGALAAGPVLQLAATVQEGSQMNVIPAPRSITGGGSGCTLDGATTISTSDAPLQAVAGWLRRESARMAGIELSTAGASGTAIRLDLDPGLSPELVTTGVSPTGDDPGRERYALVVDSKGVRVTGATAEGIFRGATTLLQLIATNASDNKADLPAMDIADAPRFAWRGLSFDVVRAFHPGETVKRVIDLLALYKMNVLHLHLTDSEGWRFDVPAYPELTGVSGKTARNDRRGGFYSEEEFADIVTYATERFITIVPEFDSPGHTASVLRAYPELGTPEILDSPEAMRYLHPDVPGVWDLVGAVYDAMAEATPGPWLHIGGDEAIAMDVDTFTRYMDTAMPRARQTGKGIVAWQESARAGFSDGDLMQHWIPPHLVDRVREAVANPQGSWLEHSFPDPDVRDAFVALFLQAPDDPPKAIDQGAKIIVSRADKLYLDTKYTEKPADAAQEDTHQRVGMPAMVYGSGTVEESYAWDPATLQEELPVDRIAGIEAAIWCETIEDERDLLFQLLPRLPGVAEKGWSDVREWSDYLPRIAAQRTLWDRLDLTYFASPVVWPNE